MSAGRRDLPLGSATADARTLGGFGGNAVRTRMQLAIALTVLEAIRQELVAGHRVPGMAGQALEWIRELEPDWPPT